MQNNQITAEALDARREFCLAAEDATTALREFGKQWDSAIEICEQAILETA